MDESSIDDGRSGAFERPGPMLEPQQFDELGLGRPIQLEAVEVCFQRRRALGQIVPWLGLLEMGQRRALQVFAGGDLGDGVGDRQRG